MIKLFEEYKKGIKFNNRHNKSHKIDGRTIWESRSPAVVGVIIAKYYGEDYVLFGKRGKGSADYQGYWNLPCGYLDWDENGYDGICREVYEETGVYIPEILENEVIIDNHLEQPFYVNTDTKENRQNVSLSYGLYFQCDKFPKLTDENSEPDEVEDLKWVKIDDIGKYKIAFNHDDRLMMYYSKIKD